jgi:DNA-binding CsgD family transcriptional regulator
MATMLQRTSMPAVLLQPPSDRIVAASPAAAALLHSNVHEVIGRRIAEFFDDRLTGGLELLAEGSVQAYEVRRRLCTTGDPVGIWVRRLPVPGGSAAVVVLVPEPRSAEGLGHPLPTGQLVAVGAVDPDLRVSSISSGVAAVGPGMQNLVGVSLLELVDATDAPRLMELAAHDDDGSGWTPHRTVRARLKVTGPTRCEVVLVSTVEKGALPFAIMTIGDPIESAERALQAGLRQIPVDARATAETEAFANAETHRLLRKLAAREVDVVFELLKGNRVSAIAQTLYLSQGTVRNHLSSAYRKLGVRNQQELLDLLRRPGGMRQR